MIHEVAAMPLPDRVFDELFLRIPAAVLRRVWDRAWARDVLTVGVYDVRSGAVNIWSRPWAGPDGDRAGSTWLASFAVSWDPPMIMSVRCQPGVHLATVREHFNRLAGVDVWQPGCRQRAVVAMRTQNADLVLRERVGAAGKTGAEPPDRFPLLHRDGDIWTDAGLGVTRHSVQAARCVRRHGLIGAARRLTVYLSVPSHPLPPPFQAEILGDRGRLWLSGICCGYLGEGARGAWKVARMFGFLPQRPLHAPLGDELTWIADHPTLESTTPA